MVARRAGLCREVALAYLAHICRGVVTSSLADLRPLPLCVCVCVCLCVCVLAMIMSRSAIVCNIQGKEFDCAHLQICRICYLGLLVLLTLLSPSLVDVLLVQILSHHNSIAQNAKKA